MRFSTDPHKLSHIHPPTKKHTISLLFLSQLMAHVGPEPELLEDSNQMTADSWVYWKNIVDKGRLRERKLFYSKVIIQHCLLHSLQPTPLLFTTDEQEAVSFWTCLELGEGNAWAHLAEKTTNVHHLHLLKYTFSLHVFDTSLILGFKRGCWKLLLSINNLPTDNPLLLSFQILSYSFTTPSPMWTFTNCKKKPIFSSK